MKYCHLFSCIAFLGLIGGCAATSSSVKGNENMPIVVGYGVGTFEVGELLYETDFSDAENWDIQLEEKPDSPLIGYAKTEGGILDIYAPERGCTSWIKKKFSGPIAVTYRVICPLETLEDEDIQARDINNFWHASDPSRANDVFDDHYTGNFLTYHEMLGYYASTGGGGKQGNQTTRFRRYPRWNADKQDIGHISLNDKDGNPDYMLIPGKWHTVQLVAFNGMVQYIVDGKVVYQIREGDTVMVETRPDGKPVAEEAIYNFDDFPPYTEGYVGLRMVGTHHKYKDLKVYRLNPVK